MRCLFIFCLLWLMMTKNCLVLTFCSITGCKRIKQSRSVSVTSVGFMFFMHSDASNNHFDSLQLITLRLVHALVEQ